MIEGSLFALSIGTIISGYFYFLACRHIRDLKSEICSLKIMVSRNKDLICSYDSYLDSISNSTKDRIKNLETIMHEFCCKKLPTVEEMEDVYDKLRREATAFKKVHKKDYEKLEAHAKDVRKKSADIAVRLSGLDDAVERIKQVNIDDFNEYRDMVEQEIKQNNEMVFRRIEDIARDFHVLLTKVKDGSFKEMKILSEDEYLRLKKLK